MRRCSASLGLPHSYCPLLSVSSYFSCALFQRCFWAKFRTLHSAQEQWLFWSMWARKKRKGTQIVKKSKIHPWLLSPRERKSDRQELFPSNSSFTSAICKERGSLPVPWQTWFSLPRKQKNQIIFHFPCIQSHNLETVPHVQVCGGGGETDALLHNSSRLPIRLYPCNWTLHQLSWFSQKQVTFNFGLRDKPISIQPLCVLLPNLS